MVFLSHRSPNSNSTKGVIKEWLKENNIEFN